VVERQDGQLANRTPSSVGGIGAGHEMGAMGRDESIIGDGDHAPASVPAGIAEGIELPQVHIPNTGLFLQFAPSRLVKTHIVKNEPRLL
jgi:hypothetical protein